MLLRLVTFNVRGLSDVRKFDKVKEMCKNEDVILLQETNWNDEKMEEIRKRWNGEILYNNGDDRQGRGVAILIKEKSGVTCNRIYNDNEGKCLAFEMEYEGKTITMVNVHAPTQENQKEEYFNNLSNLMEKYKEIIMMGDFNTVFSKVEMGEGMIFRADKGRRKLKLLMEGNNMIDIWRERNEKKREYSRRQLVGNFMCKTRIDFILCTRNMEDYIGNIKYEETSLSDHKPMFMQLDWSKVKRGPGVWILNTQVLKNEDYVLKIQRLIEEEKKNEMYTEDKRLWWENVKYLIKNCSIKYCKVIQKIRRKKEEDVKKQLTTELSKNGEDVQKIKELEGILKEIEEQKYEGARLRSKAKYTVEGEKCTRFFFNLEKSRGKAKTIKELRKEEGVVIDTNEEILEEVKHFYDKLFRAEGVIEEDKIDLLKQIKTTIGEIEKKKCDERIKEEEIKRAINELNKNKSPGIDGIGNEFYIVLRDTLTGILKEVYEEIFQQGELNIRMGMGLMELIYKGKGDIVDLKNYRPITMLNTDLKILSKVLANRLKGIMPGIIKTNQVYGVKGRDIADTTISIKDTVRYMNENKKRGFLISLDFEKAFDRVEHSFLFDILRSLGFGENFKKWIHILYKGVKTRIKCNGFLTQDVNITRSIRQGCPLSALLYSLVAEPLGLMIKRDEGIKGIGVEGQENKIFQYADDTTLLIKDIESVKRAMQLVQKYCRGSGAKINENKTEYMRLGEVMDLVELFSFKETKEIKILGVIVGKDEKKADDIMWDELLGGIERRLIFWKNRTLTLKGKVLVLNVLMVSKLWYVLYVSAMPMWVEKRLKKCFLDFLWRGKPTKIAYDTLIGEMDKGGLGLMDVEQRKNCLRVKIIKKYLDREKEATWKGTMAFFLNKCGNANLGDSILWMRTKNWMAEKVPDFYKELLRAWGKMLNNVHFKPLGREDILNQPLFLNNCILNQGKKIFLRKWWEAGIVKVRDTLYEFKEGFLPLQCITDAMEETREEYSRQDIKKQYETIKAAIPHEWIETIERKDGETQGVEVYVRIRDKLNPFKECTVKSLYRLFRDAIFKEPVVNEYWMQKYDIRNGNNIWGNMKGIFIQTKLTNLEYFIRHKMVFTEVVLSKIGMEQEATCKVCKQDDEGLLHLFIYCKQLDDFNERCMKIISNLKGEEESEWDKVLMLGLEKESTCKNKRIINLLIILMKNAIWERRYVMRKEKVLLNVWNVFKRKFEKYVQCLFYYFYHEKKMDVFYNVFTHEVCEILKDGELDISSLKD